MPQKANILPKREKIYLAKHYRFLETPDSPSVYLSFNPPEIPMLAPAIFIPERLVSFSSISKKKICVSAPPILNVGVHFYLADYRFHCILRNTDKYIPLLKQYGCVFTPDISIYTDMEKFEQMKNTYISREVGRQMQRAGITVIPTVSWSDESSFSFCFEGIPRGSVVSVSSVGVMRDKEAAHLFGVGYHEMIKRLEPSTVLFYGSLPDCDLGCTPIRRYDNTNFTWVKKNQSLIKEGI